MKIEDLIKMLEAHKGKDIDFVVGTNDDNIEAELVINNLEETHTEKKYHNLIELVLQIDENYEVNFVREKNKITADQLGMVLMVEENRTDVRYFSCGFMDERGFTGLVHGYEGGGEYSEWFYYNGDYVDSDTFDEYDDDDYIDEFSMVVDAVCDEVGDSDFYDTIIELVGQFIEWDDDNCSYYLKDEMKPVFEDKNIACYGVDIDAVDYGNTSFTEDENNYTDDENIKKYNEILKNNK